MTVKRITYRQMVAEFLSFLKENNALNGYQKAVRKQRRSYFKTIENNINPFTIEPIRRLFRLELYCEFINTAFKWSPTLEGYAYWEKLDSKWRKKIIGLEIQVVNEKIYKQ
jgi:hypothetical protein